MKKNKIKRTDKKPELKNPDSSVGYRINTDNKSTSTENHIPNEFDAQIDEFDSMTYFNDLFSDYTFPADDLSFELKYELEQRIKQIKSNPNSLKEQNYYAVHLLEFWQNILEDLRGFLTSRQLYALDYCIGTYASVCTCPYERRKEIRRNIFLTKDWFERNLINRDEFLYLIGQIEPLILFELTEIILNSDVIYHCAPDPENSLHYTLLENDFLIPSASNQKDPEEINSDAKIDQIKNDFEARLKFELDYFDKSDEKLQKLQENLNKTDNSEDRMQLLNDYHKSFETQNVNIESLSFTEFADKYQEYMGDVMRRFEDHRSDLISDDNFIYVQMLYIKYIEGAFDEFTKEFKKQYQDQLLQRKYILPYSEFEKNLYYHAYCLCYHQGKVSPNFDDVNKMIGTKPYGDSSLYPQNQIWQIIGFPRATEHNLWRDYYCELAIWQHELTKRQSGSIAHESLVQENNFISNNMINGE